MKKITLLLLLVFTTIVSAQESRLTIFSEDGEPFYVFLNGVRQNETSVVNIAVDFLTNDFYDTKIVFANEAIPTLEKKRTMLVDVDGRRGEMVYKIKNTKRGRKLRFFSFTPYAEILPPPPSVTIVKYNTVPLPQIGVTTTTTQTITGQGDQIGVGVNIGGTNIGVGINVNTGVNTTTTTTTTTGQVPTEIIVEEEGCFAMTSPDFSQALSSIEAKTFSESRLTLAKQITKNNCLTAAQILQITNLFDFEDTKLDYAKFAYPFCYNPENYWKVNDAFDFESSIEELDEYISSLGY